MLAHEDTRNTVAVEPVTCIAILEEIRIERNRKQQNIYY